MNDYQPNKIKEKILDQIQEILSFPFKIFLLELKTIENKIQLV